MSKIWIYVLSAVVLLSAVLAVQFSVEKRKAYDRLAAYPVRSINTEFGKLSYVDEGSGEVVLISHGLFGGYDQGYVTLHGLLGNSCREIAPSRFGYPGSDLPVDPSPENQARAFLELLDRLSIKKVYIMTASAGGAAGIQFVLRYPDRVKGLILLSSGVPSEKKARKDLPSLMGPPEAAVHDFPIWLSIRYFSFIFESMFASQVDSSIFNTMLPVAPRRKGIIADETVTNFDMLVNYDDYPVENIKVPVLMIQSKDDPMVKYSDAEKFIARVHPETAIFETGGHLITGHGNAISKRIKSFIEKTK
jgi:pimeloyl-ACP methyl ester carboxylesterase